MLNESAGRTSVKVRLWKVEVYMVSTCKQAEALELPRLGYTHSVWHEVEYTNPLVGDEAESAKTTDGKIELAISATYILTKSGQVRAHILSYIS